MTEGNKSEIGKRGGKHRFPIEKREHLKIHFFLRNGIDHQIFMNFIFTTILLLI